MRSLTVGSRFPEASVCHRASLEEYVGREVMNPRPIPASGAGKRNARILNLRYILFLFERYVRTYIHTDTAHTYTLSRGYRRGEGMRESEGIKDRKKCARNRFVRLRGLRNSFRTILTRWILKKV